VSVASYSPTLRQVGASGFSVKGEEDRHRQSNSVTHHGDASTTAMMVAAHHASMMDSLTQRYVMPHGQRRPIRADSGAP